MGPVKTWSISPCVWWPFSWQFFLKFLADTCPFWGPLAPLFFFCLKKMNFRSFSFFLWDICRTCVHWHLCFGFMVMSPLGFKVRVDSALFTFCRGEYNVHSPRSTSGATHGRHRGGQQCSQSLPHMHQPRWDLARIQTSNHPDRRRMCYHCTSDQAFYLLLFFTLYLQM